MLNTKMLFALAMSVMFIASVSQAQDQKPLAVGDKAIDFELETFDNKTVKLSDRFGKNGKPVILLFSRANW